MSIARPQPIPTTPAIDRDDPVLQAVAAYFDQYGWPPNRCRLLVALSGGADSVTLLTVLHLLAAGHEWRLGAAHVNYHLRGEESDADEAFCRDLCRQLDVSLIVHHAHRPTTHPVNVQAWARRERYALFARLMASEGYDLTAIGHTLDDRAESVAAAVIEARGTFALSGIPPIRDGFIRPLIDLRRDDILAFASRYSLGFRSDSSNRSPAYLRNRIRLEHLPKWEALNPAIQPGLARLSEQLWRQENYLFKEADRILGEAMIATTAQSILLNATPLSGTDRALDPFLLRILLHRAGSSIVPTYETVERFTELRVNRRSGVVEQGELVIERSKDTITLRCGRGSEAPVIEPVRVNPDECVTFGHWTLAATVEGATGMRPIDDRQEALLDWNCVSAPLVLRKWQPGDRYQPFGLNGHKSLADLFAERGVPRGERPTVPILTDGQGIVWPIGHPIADRVKITPDSQSILRVKVSRQ